MSQEIDNKSSKLTDELEKYHRQFEAIETQALEILDGLTDAQLSFGATGPIDSIWTLGSPVLWRNAKGQVYVRGNVTAVDPARLLRFTVCDVGPERRPISGLFDDEITQTYALQAGERGGAILSTAHGDFVKLADGERLYPLVVQLWDRLLPRIKELAEAGPHKETAYAVEDI